MDMEILKIKSSAVLKTGFRIFTLMSLIILCSCEKNADVKLPDTESKLVVISFISPQDTLIRVSVKLSQPLFNNARSNKYEPVTNAEVIISGNGFSASLAYNKILEEYTGDPLQLKVSEGVVYYIRVTTPDGKSVEATTTIPAINTSLNYTFLPETNSLKIDWIDPPSGKDYYRAMLESSSNYIYSGYDQNGFFADTILQHGVWYAELFADSDYPDSRISAAVSYFSGHEGTDSVNVHLMHTSKEYYDYTNKLYSAYNTDNPFQEASLMFTNIKGGFGVFAGYNDFVRALKE